MEAGDSDCHSKTSENKMDASQEPPPMPSGPKTRYDWYQTQTHVVVTIMLKNAKKEDVNVNIQEKNLSATVKLPSGSDYSLELDLSHPIIPSESQTKVLSTKIEIKLKKEDGIQWRKLEGEDELPGIKQSSEVSGSSIKYPSSSRHTTDWNKLAHEVEDEEKGEKKEGDAALNELFQKIFKDGTDETKKAMMKSFYESGGTVLSTNWNEVGEKKVEVKPPDGMEYKEWEH